MRGVGKRGQASEHLDTEMSRDATRPGVACGRLARHR
jgi:hypothetical protein